MNSTLQKVEAFGSHLNVNDFAELMEPEKLRALVLSACQTYYQMYNLDPGALANTIIAAIYKAKESHNPEKGSTFRTHANNQIRWAVLSGLSDNGLVNTAPVHTPHHKRSERPTIVRLDLPIQTDEPEGKSFLEQVTTNALNGSDRLEAFEMLHQLRSEVAEMLGILRIIPLSIHTRARDIDVFECMNGLNDRGMDGTYQRDAIGKLWNIHPSNVDLIVNRIWKHLIIARSPIVSKLELQNVLAKIEMLEGAVNEFKIIRPVTPVEQRRIKILEYFKTDLRRARQQRKDRKACKEFQLDFNGIGFEKAPTKKETMALIVRKAFGFSEAEFKSKKECGDRVSKARYLTAYLLMTDLCATKFEAARLIGRKADMAMYGMRFIKARVQEQDIYVLGALAAIRREYRALFP